MPLYKANPERTLIEIGKFRVEKAPRTYTAVATKELLDDTVTARHYKEVIEVSTDGKLERIPGRDVNGEEIVVGKEMTYHDWRGRHSNPCWIVYEFSHDDTTLMVSGPRQGQKIITPRWKPVENGVFDSEEAALACVFERLGISPVVGTPPEMVFLNDRVLDFGLNVLDTEADRFDICSAEPATYTAATSTNTLGNKDHGASGSAFGSPVNGDTSGRKVASTAVTDGSVTGTGTASHWAVSEVGNTRLLAAQTLSSSQAVTSGNTWAMASLDIELPDPS